MKLVISGSVPSQKNRKIISVNPSTKRPFLRTAPQVKVWQEAAEIELRQQWKGYRMTGYPISLSLIFYYDSRRRHDLDNALSSVMDALVKSEVIEDDSTAFVECITIQFGGYDKTNPRCEVFLDE